MRHDQDEKKDGSKGEFFHNFPILVFNERKNGLFTEVEQPTGFFYF
jgi:hypothetical protein